MEFVYMAREGGKMIDFVAFYFITCKYPARCIIGHNKFSVKIRGIYCGGKGMDRETLDMFSLAVETASIAHQTQTRKGNGTPYITHSFTVGMMLLEAGCSSEIVVAGILHDTIEDTSITYEDIKHTFGTEVARIVKECSEHDKSKSWEERKQHTLDNIAKISLEACMVVCADKLHNIRSTAKDFDRIGAVVWAKFNRGREQQEWYYRGLVEALGKRAQTFSLYKMLKEEVEELFAK
jgi:(p)ppGpp synthase/HD superfamily hydrolase